MNKRIVIKIGPGSIETGYTAAVQIGEEGMPPQVETQAHLLAAPDLPDLYRRWQQTYRLLGLPYRLEAHSGVTNVSNISQVEACRTASRDLRDRLHHWLNSDAFRPIREKILEQLNPEDTARILLQTQDPLLQRLPWYELQFFQRYRQAEVAIGSLDYQQVIYPGTRSGKVRILAVLGDATGLNTQTDQTLLSKLPNADIQFLKEPSRETFNQRLWDAKGWDILFFAGHSNSRSDCAEGSGEIALNATDQLTIPQLKHALKKAIDRGLNTAIFNSCDGLGLAADLADLHIPQVLVMREPVPDQVAHAFLQGFLDAFSAGTPFYIAVREAREKLQGLEARYPCATWLPVIVQNLAETPPTWLSLQGKSNRSQAAIAPPSPFPPSPFSPLPTRNRWQLTLTAGLILTAALLICRQLGLLESLELKAYDHFLRSRPTETVDSRLLIITNTSDDIDRRPNTTGSSSLSDATLSALLNKLTLLEPQLIGLDIYRNFSAQDPALAQQLKNTDNLIAICKIPDPTTEAVGKAPPPEIESPLRIAANDFVTDKDSGRKLRRHLLYLEPIPGFLCPGETFSTVIAQRYLKEVHNISRSSGLFIGAAPLPRLSGSFGGYHNLDSDGVQILLNYRILDPKKTTCGEVKETPADCLTVTEFLNQDPDQLRSSVKGRIVLIGTTDIDFGYQDRWLTPYTTTSFPEDQTPGVFLQAQMISQLLSAALGQIPLLTSWPEWQEMIWIASWAMLGGWIGTKRYARWRLGLWLRLLIFESLLLLACWLWLVYAAVWVPWVPSALALPAAGLTAQTALTVRSRNQKTIPSAE
ncbi:CHASE2 domain-containing protein [Leptolyngbya sp. BC1307]|uniref:CHASE2 domain-containing protein n=1 Tax=Leptolyngbya sp. BC1307 TaxID=2029589 RepID=UPI000EFD5528|nr:CHASE2 domain-containing protein [Leptolyngbya sp. BC1307]